MERTSLKKKDRKECLSQFNALAVNANKIMEQLWKLRYFIRPNVFLIKDLVNLKFRIKQFVYYIEIMTDKRMCTNDNRPLKNPSRSNSHFSRQDSIGKNSHPRRERSFLRTGSQIGTEPILMYYNAICILSWKANYFK